MSDGTVERFCIFGLFGASIAIFAWKHAGPRADAGDVPSAVPPEDVPTASELFSRIDASMIVGMSYLPDTGISPGPAHYVSNCPTARPPLPAARPLVR